MYMYINTCIYIYIYTYIYMGAGLFFGIEKSINRAPFKSHQEKKKSWPTFIPIAQVWAVTSFEWIVAETM